MIFMFCKAKEPVEVIALKDIGSVGKVNPRIQFPDEKDLHDKLMFIINVPSGKLFFQTRTIQERKDWLGVRSCPVILNF